MVNYPSRDCFRVEGILDLGGMHKENGFSQTPVFTGLYVQFSADKVFLVMVFVLMSLTYFVRTNYQKLQNIPGCILFLLVFVSRIIN